MGTPKPKKLTYKQLLLHVQSTVQKELEEEAILFNWVLGGLLAAFLVIGGYCLVSDQAKDAAVQVFCTTSVLAAVASAAYLFIKADDIKRRNNNLLLKIQEDMDEENKKDSNGQDPNMENSNVEDPHMVSLVYLKKMAEDKVIALFEEKTRIPFKP